MGDTLPWVEFEMHYNKHLKKDFVGAGEIFLLNINSRSATQTKL